MTNRSSDHTDRTPDASDPATGNPDPGTRADPAVGEGLLDEAMGPSSAMAHLYRGEVHRMKYWRERLDKTTNWAVVVMAAILTWSFSGRDNPHYLILIGVAALAVFLVMEARRYRGYEIWRTRVRLLQENVWSPGLDPKRGHVDDDWREVLAADYREPTVKISTEEAVAHRLRRVYLPLFCVLLAAWLVRISAFTPESWLQTARIGMIPGPVVVTSVVVFYLGAFAVALRPRTWRAKGELRTEDLRRD